MEGGGKRGGIMRVQHSSEIERCVMVLLDSGKSQRPVLKI